MQSYDYNVVVKRLHRFERRARWHWVERLLTLGLVARLLLIGPAGTSLRDEARLQAQTAAEDAGLAFAEGANAARRALLVRPALDPQVVLEDQREASMDTMPMSPDETAPLRVAQATTAPITRPRVNQQPPLLAERQPICSPTYSSQAVTPVAAAAAPPAASESAAAWSSSVSEAERQMARAAESTAEPMAELMGSPAAGGVPAFRGAGLAQAAVPLPRELAAPQTLWKAVGAARWHPRVAAGRDPFAFVEPPAAPLGQPADAQSTQAVRSSPSEPFALSSAPALSSSVARAPESVAPATVPAVTVTPPPPVSLKALGYAVSADGNAQAVLTDGSTLYVVNEGEEFADRFRVIAIRSEALEVEDELTNQTIRLPLGD